MKDTIQRPQSGARFRCNGMITLIAARSRNGAIGKDGGIPWFIPEDLARFRRETIGGALIMGRLTWDSLPRKPLEGRLNVVVTSRSMDGVETTSSPDDAVAHCKAVGLDRIYGIGGSGIYLDLLPRAHRMLITEVDVQIPEADAFFPVFNEADWVETDRRSWKSNGYMTIARELMRRDLGEVAT